MYYCTLLTAETPPAGGASKQNQQDDQDQNGNCHNNANNSGNIQVAARRLARRADAHLIVVEAQLVGGPQGVGLGGVLQRQSGNGQGHVVLVVAEVLWLVGRVPSVAATLSDDGSIDGPLDLGLWAGPDGNVHDGSVVQIQAVDRGVFILVDRGI